jgi:hypothetical protein
MNASEAISNSSGIIIQLIDRIKDRQTAALVAQLQAHHFTIQHELVRLESENANLALDKRNFESQILKMKEAHRQEIEKVTSNYANPNQDGLDETSKQMLITLANKDPQTNVTDDDLIQIFGLQKARGDYLFSQLRERSLISINGGQMGRGMFCSVTDAGLKYLKENGLLDAKPQKIIPSRRDSGVFRVRGRAF